MRNLPLSRQRLSTGISASMTDIGMKRIDLGIYRTVGPVKPGREQACAGSVDCCRVLCRPRVIYRLAYSCVRTRPAVRSNLPMNFPNREFRSDETNLPSKQTIAVAFPYQVPKEPVRSNERPAATVWVTVLLAAKVHTGPSIDTPISHFYPAGTSLHATHYLMTRLKSSIRAP